MIGWKVRVGGDFKAGGKDDGVGGRELGTLVERNIDTEKDCPRRQKTHTHTQTKRHTQRKTERDRKRQRKAKEKRRSGTPRSGRSHTRAAECGISEVWYKRGLA